MLDALLQSSRKENPLGYSLINTMTNLNPFSKSKFVEPESLNFSRILAFCHLKNMACM